MREANETSHGMVGRRKLLLIGALFLAPVLLAIVGYFLAPRIAPAPSVHGTLIEPARPLDPFSIADVSLNAPGDEPFTLDDVRGHWTLIQPVGPDCRESCRQRLHYTRQIRAALGKDRDRVARVVLAPKGRATPGLAGVLNQHPGLTVLRAPVDGALAVQFPPAPAATVFVIDPLGNLMLRFGPEVAPDGILEDLETLLRLSQIG